MNDQARSPAHHPSRRERQRRAGIGVCASPELTMTMKTKPNLTLLGPLLLAPLSVLHGLDRPRDFESWPVAVVEQAFQVEPDGIRRVGFTLPPESRGRRVVVAFWGLLDSQIPAGYSPALALEVNGEVMGLQLAGRCILSIRR